MQVLKLGTAGFRRGEEPGARTERGPETIPGEVHGGARAGRSSVGAVLCVDTEPSEHSPPASGPLAVRAPASSPRLKPAVPNFSIFS